MVELRDRELRPHDGETEPHTTLNGSHAGPSTLPLAFPGRAHTTRQGTGPFKGKQPARNGSTEVSTHHRYEADDTSQVD